MSLIYNNQDIMPIVRRAFPDIRDGAVLVVTNMPTYFYPADVNSSKVNSVDLKTYEAPRGDGTIIQFTGALIEIGSDQYFILLETIADLTMQPIAYTNGDAI